MTDEANNKAVIYCRVASATQSERDNALKLQEERCRDYAGREGYSVINVFVDHASGSTADRPGMNAMLAYLREHQDKPHTVLIDDVSRLARSLSVHHKVRKAIQATGGSVQSPAMNLSNDAQSQLLERIRLTATENSRSLQSEPINGGR